MEPIITAVVVPIVFALGASIGSFLNVVAYRIPAGLSILSPPSRCPKCFHKLRKHENVPVFGWIWLGGRCAHCRNPISPRYPIVEASTGLLFLLILFMFVQTPTLMVGYWAFFSWLLVLSLIDSDTMTLPNPLTQSGLVAGLVFQIGNGFAITSSFSGAAGYLMKGIAGAVIGIWLFDIISIVASIFFGQTAMGAGDAKLAATIGAWLGWKYLLVASFLACGVGAFVGGGAIALGLLSRRQPMPFGPFLALGAAISAIWGEALLSTYLQLFFPVS